MSIGVHLMSSTPNPHRSLFDRLGDKCRVEKQKRRSTGFLSKIALKDSTYRHLNVLTSSDLRQMALGFFKVRTQYNAIWNQLCL